jgi:hypothetical protein
VPAGATFERPKGREKDQVVGEKGVSALKRFIQVFALVVVLAGVVTGAASALAFADADYIWPTGGVGEPYFKQILGRTDGGNCDPSKCTFVLLAGEFPPGISMTSDGKVSGTPQKLGTWSFWLQLRGNYGGTPAEREFSLTINRIKLKVATSTLPPVIKGSAYSQTLAAEGGSGPKTWSVTSGKLPDGLTLDPATGAITGTPTVNGDFVFTVKVADSSPSPDTHQFLLRVVEPLGVGPISARARVAEIGIAFSLKLTGTGGTQPYTWAASGALPAGLALDPATGVISGTPTSFRAKRLAGVTRLTFVMTDANGFTKSVNLAFTVVAKLTIVTKRLPAVTAGGKIALSIARQGGARPFKWKLLSGKLPRNVKLDPKTGKLVGTPAAAGKYRFRVGVTDALGATSTKPFALSVKE